ncbi:MAG: hypothetical protein ACHQU0_02525 [Candidatus Paceibacteria bacterium]
MRNHKELKRTVKKGIRLVFFAAMKEGYATDRQKGTIVELPGSKTLTYVQGPWKVVDVYFVTPLSARSGGMTIISYGDIPVWIGQYNGWYKESAIPCLKAALAANYRRHRLLGCRGPRQFEHKGIRYLNSPDRSSGFNSSGSEEIQDPKGTVLGWHNYRNMMLI